MRRQRVGLASPIPEYDTPIAALTSKARRWLDLPESGPRLEITNVLISDVRLRLVFASGEGLDFYIEDSIVNAQHDDSESSALKFQGDAVESRILAWSHEGGQSWDPMKIRTDLRGRIVEKVLLADNVAWVYTRGAGDESGLTIHGLGVLKDLDDGSLFLHWEKEDDE